MVYNYLKITLNSLKPKNNDPGDLLKMARSISQQSLAFTREFQGNLLTSKDELGELIPAIKLDPEKKGKKKEEIELETPVKDNIGKKITGSDLLEIGVLERRRIINKKKYDYNKNNQFFH